MKILNYILLTVLFIAIAFIIVAYASGYKIDFTSKNISATGLIDIQTGVKDAKIYLNNELVGEGRITSRNLSPGRFEIKVSKSGYHDWLRSIDLSPGEAEVFNDVILFKENPAIEKFDFGSDKNSLMKLSDTNKLRSNGGEIYQNDFLVTRFASDVFGLCWYTDPRYIAFTSEGRLKIVEIDGTNLNDILEKDSSGPVVFVNSGRSLIYENKGEIFRAEIR